MIMYYGSKISENITKTPEGYLIARNVPIGRTGYMEYYGEEIGIDERRGEVIKVHRSNEELFSKATIASFEGKPVTNNHPNKNLNLDTVGLMSKGHIENVRPDGEYLVADLYVIDSFLINEIEQGKREVSCGYDCLWEPTDNGEFEQKQIIGNHVAVVKAGRAGPLVSIKDSAPEQINLDERSKKRMAKITLKALAALGFKHFAKDAEPEEIEKAMDEMGGLEVGVVDMETPAGEAKESDAIAQILAGIKSIEERLTALEKSDKGVHQELGADAEMENLEKEVSDEAKEEEENEVQDASETVEPEAQDEAPEAQDEEKEEEVMDSKHEVVGQAFDSTALINMMKPIIMNIADEKSRNEAAKSFAKAVRDSRGVKTSKNSYGDIVKNIADVRKQSMDTQQQQRQTQAQATATMVSNFNKMNAQNKGVK